MHLLVRHTIAVAVLFAGTMLPARAFGEVRWNTDVARAGEAARAANRPMLLEFWAAWCAACKAMDAQVFADPRVAEATGKFTPVRIDMDRDAHIARKYEVEATPTFIFTDSYGRELFRHTGLLGLDAYLGLLLELPGDVTDINRLGEAVARHRDDFEALESLGQTLRGSRFYRASTEYLERALRTRGARSADVSRRAAMLMTIAKNHEAL